MSKHEPGASGIRNFQLFIVDVTFTIAGILSIAGGLWSIYRDSATLAATCMAVGLILLFAATLHRFELLKGFGVEAKMKKLDDTIDKAEVALSRLKDLAEVTNAAIISLSSSAGRFGGAPSISQAKALADSVKVTLEKLGSDSETVRGILSPWVKTEVGDLVRAALQSYATLVQEKEYEFRTEKMKGVECAEQQALATRLNAMLQYREPIFDQVKEQATDQLVRYMNSVVSNSPELSEAEKQTLLTSFKPFQDEIDYFLVNLNFKNVQFWIEHIPQRT
jgi:hypothetical protein